MSAIYGGNSPVTLTSGEITSGYLGNASVVSGSIASGAVGHFAIGSGAIQSGQIGSGQLGVSAIASGFILPGAGIGLAGNGLSGWTITNLSGAGGGGGLSSGSVTSGYIGNGAVVSGSIASGQVGQFALSSGAVTSGAIGNAAVVSGSIASGVIGIAGYPVNTPPDLQQSLLFNGANWAAWVPPGVIYGLNLANPNASTNQYTVAYGQCADSTNTVMIQATNSMGGVTSPLGAFGTVSITASGLQGNDSYTIPTTSGYANTTSGTSYVQFSTNPVPYLNPISLNTVNGTTPIISQSGTAVVCSQSLYGLASVGDLIGASGTYSRISAVQSGGTYYTVLQSGSIASGAAWNVVQNPIVSFGSGQFTTIGFIRANTSGGLSDAQTFTASGLQMTVGGVYSGAGALRTVFMYPYVGNLSGNGAAYLFCSTQLTKPYAATYGLAGGANGPIAYYRRIGSFGTASGAIIPFNQYGNSNHREYGFQGSQQSTSGYYFNVPVSGWCRFTPEVAPPTANYLNMIAQIQGGTTGNYKMFLQPGTDSINNAGSNVFVQLDYVDSSMQGIIQASYVEVGCDGSQSIFAQLSLPATSDGYLTVAGYQEDV